MERRLRHNYFHGGSLIATFYRYAPLGKRLVVLANRKESYNKASQSFLRNTQLLLLQRSRWYYLDFAKCPSRAHVIHVNL